MIDWRTQVHPSWLPVLEPLSERLDAIESALAQDPRGFLPAAPHVLAALTLPLPQVRVLLLGQDPYPTPGHAVGLSFSVAPGVAPPRSLRNIFRELEDDVGLRPPTHGDLRAWTQAGVLLLNRCLTVAPGAAGSHRGLGWEQVTDAVIEALVARDAPLVAILWGRDAQQVAPLLGSTPVVASAHPSPLSASRGFFGSRPFSRTNALLVDQGAAPINWTIPSEGLLW